MAPGITLPALVGVVSFALTNVTLIGTDGAGGPYTFNASGLPAGVSLTSAGVISGTPTTVSTGTYRVSVKDKAGNLGPVVSASFAGAEEAHWEGPGLHESRQQD